MSTLPAKQERFVREYLIDLNAAQAAIRAGYSKRSANVIGCRLLRKPDVRDAIEAGRKAVNEQLVMQRQEVLERLTLLGRADPRRLYREDGTIKPMHELDDVAAASIAGVEIEQRAVVEVGRGRKKQRVAVRVAKIKHRDPVRALEMLGRHHKLFENAIAAPISVFNIQINL